MKIFKQRIPLPEIIGRDINAFWCADCEILVGLRRDGTCEHCGGDSVMARLRHEVVVKT